MTAPLDTIRVVHVDDESEFAEMAATFLEREDERLAVETASGASEGLAFLAEHDVDCIVSDYDMPGRNGIEFLEDVREVQPEVPFILYTGKGSEEVASDAVSAGVTDYLRKESGTGQYAVLANRITNAVERYRARLDRRRRRERRERQGNALFALTTDEAVTTGDFGTALERITETAAGVLDVTRVNVWLFDDERTTIRCVEDFDRSSATGSPDTELSVERYPAYVEALESNRSIAAVDAREDPRTAGLAAYLEEHGVGALLDATIRSGGEVVGVVCHEHGGGPREWTDDEVEFACDVADLVHRAYRKRERAERTAELERTRARFRALTENTSHAVVTVDEESTVRYATGAIEDVLGYAPDDLVGESLLTVMPERFHGRHEEAVDRYLREETRRLDWDWVELPGRRRDGHEVPLGISFGEATIDGEQRFTALVRDITERREHERELERAHDLLERTERLADVGGWEIDTDTMEVFWTENLFSLLGVDADEEPPLGEALDRYHEDDRPVVEDAVEAALDSGDPFDVEARFRRPDGEVRWLQVRGTPTTEAGEVVTLRGAVKDVTDQRRREGVLREMHDVISDRSQSFEEQVGALLELGRTELDTRYGTLSEIRGDEYVFEVVSSDDDSIRAGEVVPVSATNCELVATAEETVVLGDIERDAPGETDRAGFTERGISCYIGAPVVVDDNVYGTFCFYDTDPRDGQFSEWETTLVDLMSRWVSYELQRRLANERLHEQNERLERFASILSHDLRNPLNVARGRLELAMDEGGSGHLEKVAGAHERMETLIDDLLRLAREGDPVAETEPIDLRDLVEDCWRNVDTRGATVRVGTDRTVVADRSRLEQLVENLFRNSVEHGSTGGRPRDDGVTVTVGELPDGFYVEDDGPGIPEGERDDVFGAGYSTSEEGTGFGLAIVKRVAEAHGWAVRVTGGDGGGARFEITGVGTDG